MEKDAEPMEKVQQRALREISDIHGQTYEDRLKETGLTSLRERRVRGDLIEVFKVIKGFNNVNREIWFDLQSRDEARATRTNTRIEDGEEIRRADVIYKPRHRGEIRANFFTLRTVQIWNELPDEVRDSKSVNMFKNAYDRHVKQGNS